MSTEFLSFSTSFPVEHFRSGHPSSSNVNWFQRRKILVRKKPIFVYGAVPVNYVIQFESGLGYVGTAPAATKNTSHFKSGEKCPKNNHLTSFSLNP